MRAAAGLITLALLSVPLAGVSGVLLATFDASRKASEYLYLYFWLAVLIVLLGSVAAVVLWLVLRLGAIAIGADEDLRP